MQKRYLDTIRRINCLTKDLDSLYHQAARNLGVADSVMCVVYMVHERGDGCLLYDIWNESGISKQTINSAIRKLEQDKILFLEQDKGRNKRIRLTPEGSVYVERMATKLLEMECASFEGWTEQEIGLHLELMERYNRAFRAQVEQMEGSTT